MIETDIITDKVIIIISLIFNEDWFNFVLGAPGIYPLASIASAKSAARFKDITNIGTNSEIICIIWFFNFPSLKSTPRDACAFRILSVSLNKVGINLNDIDIIIANIEVLIFNFSNGLNNSSIPFDKSVGLVVRDKIVDVNITTNILNTNNKEFCKDFYKDYQKYLPTHAFDDLMNM